ASGAWVRAAWVGSSQALERLEDGERLVYLQAARGSVGKRAGAYRALGRGPLWLHRRYDAQRLAKRAMDASIAQHGFRAHVHHLLGDVAMHAGDVEASELHHRRALAMAEPRGMRPLVARCHLGLARCYGRLGADETARAHLAKAAALCHGLGTPAWMQGADDAWA